MPNFGAGIYLTDESDLEPSWDLAVDSSGDIKTVEGEDELLKDVSYSTAIRVGDSIGSTLSPVVMNRIKARVENALVDENRIDSILLVDVREIGDSTIEVVAEADSNQETIELVFKVTL